MESSRGESVEGFYGSGDALIGAGLHAHDPGIYLWCCSDNREAERVAQDIEFFLPDDRKDQVLFLPGVETSPYRGLSPHPEVAAQRAFALWKLLRGFQGFVVTTLPSWSSRLLPPDTFLRHCIHLEVEKRISLDAVLAGLRTLGYQREDPVSQMGEYSHRGGIVDVFSPDRANPVRIELSGDRAESIREFNPGTQRSVQLVTSCEIVPMREVLVQESQIRQWHELAPGHWNQVAFAQALEEKLQFTANRELFHGFEYLVPLILDCDSHLLDYCPRTERRPARLIMPSSQQWWADFDGLQARLQEEFEEVKDTGELSLPPQQLSFGKDDLLERMEGLRITEVNLLTGEDRAQLCFDFRPERVYSGRLPEILADISAWHQKEERVVFVMPSLGMAERVVDLLHEYGLIASLHSRGFGEALHHPISVVVGKISEGFHSPTLKLHILTQDQVFGPQRPLKPRQQSRSQPQKPRSSYLSDLRDLRIGDYVVHNDHGIGQFRGLQQIAVEQERREFVELAYRGGAKLYVPPDKIHLIQKYSGAGQGKPPLDRLGSTSWQSTKSRIKESMRQLAVELLKLYARREVVQGRAFSADDVLMREFEEAFEYEETEDQTAAIRDVKQDMESDRPMDRLVCGDVGYGKTEVAMRAAFKAVNDGAQVAVLAPTTILAFQHLNTFLERFRGFPVQVEMISRFCSPQEVKDILKRTSRGVVDILIGTHRLLSKDVSFRDLGLVIVDEEQRFGVQQKERLKEMKAQADILSLSATPIPRTLNMSLIGLRDLSIIETPPKDRLAVQTAVVKFNPATIRKAIHFELTRRGQVFFVHNSVQTIYSISQMIQKLVPEARVQVAHGQMGDRMLEEVMLNFLEGRSDVLVATTIIENGLDMPRVNTLIVNRADRFGLSQLYQLRGRVGRSSRRAYAYLLIPPPDGLTTEARRRLSAIREFSELGVGFRVAARDLEIRGAGNLLGGEQHGHIKAVGFELYVKLLEQAIREIKGEPVMEDLQTAVDLGLDIRIPEHYVQDTQLRLALYKRISSAAREQELSRLEDEMVDRFGAYPRPVSNLLGYARLRCHASALKIQSVERSVEVVFIRFRNDTPLSPARVVEFVGQNPGASLTPEEVLAIALPAVDPEQIFASIRSVLDQLP